jgi:hypothetical protein
MIVTGNNAEIERNDLLHENNFKIKATGKAFAILSDGLYADKIRAVIRELSCNAYDAHVAAGNPGTPFEVHLPNVMEPHFTVRDFGIGLSKEACQELFTTYFESTKTTSNDFIGALGLGSKSPFSYVDAFTVVSRFNGIKYTFSAFIGEDDMPKLALMGEEATKEGNGLEVSMPVRRNDFNSFAERAQTVLKRFNPQPIITGTNITFKQEKIAVEGNGWRLVDCINHYGYSNRQASAIQGKIEYPLSHDALYDKLDDIHMRLLNCPFELDFQIGELEIAASREALGYKGPTVAAIRKKLDSMIAEIPSRFQAKFDNVRTLWEAHIEYASIFDHRSPMAYVLRELNNRNLLKFNVLGKEVSSTQIKVKYSDYPSVTITEFFQHGSCKSVNFAERAKLYSQNKNYNYEHYSIDLNRTVIVFKNDLKTGPNTRINRFIKQRNDGQAILINGDEADIKKLLSDLGDPPVHTTSELPKPIRSQSAKVKARSYSIERRRWSADNDLDLNDGMPGLFVYYARDIAHFTLKSASRAQPAEIRMGQYDFANFCEKLIQFKIIDKDIRIVGLNKLTFDKLVKDEDSEWELFGSHIQEGFETKWLNNTKFIDEVAQIMSAKGFVDDYYSGRLFKSLVEHKDQIDAASPIHAFLDEFVKVANTKKTDLVRNFINLTECFQHKLDVSAHGYDFRANYGLIKNRYPMINAVDMYNLHNHIDTFVQYINDVETVIMVRTKKN